MDYQALAQAFVDARSNLLQIPAHKEVSKFMQGELFVLNYLATHTGIIHPKDLSVKLAVSSARITSLLNRMEKKNLIRRLVDPEDNRQIVIELTDAGLSTAQKCRRAVISFVAGMLEDLGPEDAEGYIRIQEKIWENHRKQLLR